MFDPLPAATTVDWFAVVVGGMGNMADSPFGGGDRWRCRHGWCNGNHNNVCRTPKKERPCRSLVRKVNECMGNPAAYAKYQNDPEVAELIAEMRKYM
jgi:hypothetical protein